MLKIWDETRWRKEHYHIIMTLKLRFKGETGDNWHMLPLVDIKELGIEVRRWVGIWIEVSMEGYRLLEGWLFQRDKGERMGIQYTEEGLHEALIKMQMREVGITIEGVDVGEDRSLRILLSKG